MNFLTKKIEDFHGPYICETKFLKKKLDQKIWWPNWNFKLYIK